MDERLIARGAVFLRSEALATGFDDRTIALMVRSGAWHRVRRGAFVAGDLWQAADERQRYALRTRAVIRQARTRVVASHVSAVPEYDGPLWGLDLSTVHVTRPDGRAGRRERGVSQHRGQLHSGDVVALNAIEVTAGTRTALDITTVAETEPALVVVNHLLHSGHTDPEQLQVAYTGMERWPNTLSTDLVLRLANGLNESVGETRTHFMCWRQHLPAPELQYPIRDRSGRVVARVDFAWPEYGVFLEFDGRVKYERLLREGERASDVVIREKRREDLICELTGWRCIRIVWSDLDRPEHTSMRIRRALCPGQGAF